MLLTLPGRACWYSATCSWFHLIRPRWVSRLSVVKITCLADHWENIYPPGIGIALWSSRSPWFWKCSHCGAPINLVPPQPGSLLPRRVGAFHLWQFLVHFFPASLTSLVFISFFSQPSWLLHCVPASSICFWFFYSCLPLGPSLVLKSLFFQPTFFFPKILYPVKPPLSAVPSTWVSVFYFPHKSWHSTTCGKLNYSWGSQKTNFTNVSLSPAWKVILGACEGIFLNSVWFQRKICFSLS